jgi:hypothetical protein
VIRHVDAAGCCRWSRDRGGPAKLAGTGTTPSDRSDVSPIVRKSGQLQLLPIEYENDIMLSVDGEACDVTKLESRVTAHDAERALLDDADALPPLRVCRPRTKQTHNERDYCEKATDAVRTYFHRVPNEIWRTGPAKLGDTAQVGPSRRRRKEAQ